MAVTITTNLVERYSNGQVIISEGIVSAKAYVIISGKVRVSKKKGDRTITVTILRDGDTFGEMGLFQKAARSATATAIGEVAVGVIDRKQFEKMMEACPENMQSIINSLINRLRLTTNSLATIGIQLEMVMKSLEGISNKDYEE